MPREVAYLLLISTEIAVMCKSIPKHIMFCVSTFHKHDSMTEEKENCSRLMVYLNAIK